MNGKLIVASLVVGAAAAHAALGGLTGGGGAPGIRHRSPAAIGHLAAADTEEPSSRDELEAEQDRVERHLLRVQKKRFEARARGESERNLKRLDREFKRTQQRRIDVIDDLEAAEE